MTESDAEQTAESVPEPSFAIPRRPERQYSRGGGLTYEGTTVFALTPASVPEKGDADDPNTWLRALTERVLGADPYTYGDWFDLPMPVFLVHDRETGDVFRVAIRDGKIEFHVLPETDSGGLSALYERLCEATANGIEGAKREDGAESGNGTARATGSESTGSARNGTEEAGTVIWHVTCRTDADR